MAVSKRELLKWTTPIVVTIMLPAHAQTSATTTTAPTTTAPTTTSSSVEPLCSDALNINLSFNSSGTLFGIDDSCSLGTGETDAVILSFNERPNSQVIEIELQDATGIEFYEIEEGVREITQIFVRDALGRDWGGRVTFTYITSDLVSVTGTMTLV